MALIDHGISINNKFKALDLETNYLKVTSATHTIKEELIKCSDKVLNYLQQLTKSFQNFKNYLTNQAEDNKENSIQFGSQNSFSFDKLNSIFMANVSTPTAFKKQIAETIDSFNEFLKIWYPKNSFDTCLELGSLQELSSNVRSPVAFTDGNELKSPTLEFTKITERWKSRTAFKSRTGYTIKVNECNTSPAHRLNRIAGKEKLMFFNNFGDESPGRYFEDISPIGCMIVAETFGNNFNNLAIPIRKISEFNCETENTDENQMKSNLLVHPEQTLGTINKTDFRQKSARTVAKSEREMSTEFSIEIEEVKAEVRNPHLDENGHELLLYGLINEDN